MTPRAEETPAPLPPLAPEAWAPPAVAPEPEPTGGRPPWTFNTTVLLAGLAAMLVGVTVAFGAADPAGFFGDPFTLVLFGVPTLFLVLTAIFRKGWLHLVTGILLTLVPAMFFLFSSFFTRPVQGIAFAFAAALAAFALLTALPAGIAGLRQGRKGRPHPTFREGWRMGTGRWTAAVLGLSAGFLIVGAAAHGQLTGASGSGYDFDPSVLDAERVEMATEDFSFTRSGFNVSKGKVVEFVVENRDADFHTFTYRVGAKEYNHDLIGGQTVRFLAYFQDAGAIKFRCQPHSDGYDDEPGESMVGSFNVR